MKKTIFILFIFVFCFIFQAKSSVHFRIFAGYNSSTLFMDMKDYHKLSAKTKDKYHVGASFRFEIGKSFYIEPEVYATRKGGIVDIAKMGDSLSQNTDYMSIDAPLLFGFRPYNSEDFKFRVYAGPVLSFRQDIISKFIKGDAEVDESNIKNSLQVFSAQAGFGFDIYFITIDLKYEIGITGINTFDDVITRANVLYLTVGIKLF